jgi:hypothetical protein
MNKYLLLPCIDLTGVAGVWYMMHGKNHMHTLELSLVTVTVQKFN